MILSAKNVTKTYGQKRVLHRVNLRLEQGEIFALLGKNGAGKSTTIRLLCGLAHPNKGNIQLFGQPISRFPQIRKQVGVMIQDQQYLENLSAKENLLVFAKLKELSLSHNKLTWLLESVGLTHNADRKVKDLSHGNKKRLGLAIALIGKPKLLLLDEPTAHLDSPTIATTYQILKEITANGTAVLLTTALSHEAEVIGNRIGILENGGLLRVGTLEELRQNSIHRNLMIRIRTKEVDKQKQKQIIRKITRKTKGIAKYEPPFWYIKLTEKNFNLTEIYQIFQTEAIEIQEWERIEPSLYEI